MSITNEEESIIKLIELLDIPVFIKNIIIENASNLNLDDVITLSNNFVNKRNNILKEQQKELNELKELCEHYEELNNINNNLNF